MPENLHCKNEPQIPGIIQCVREIKQGGGVSGVAYNLEKQFKKAGYLCERFTLDNVELNEKTVSTHLRSNYYFEKIKLLRDVIVYSIKGTYKLRKYFSKGRNMVVICHNDVLFGDIYVMHGLHKAFIFQSPHKWRILLRNPLHLFLLFREELRYCLDIHKKIVAFSEKEKRDIIQFYKVNSDKIILIPNGVDIEKFRPNPKEGLDFRKELSISDNCFTLAFVGHEFERKGLKFILYALHILVKKGITPHLIVAGKDDPKKVSNILQGIEHFVHFVGDRQDINRIYNAADAFVLPSAYETWALVGLEAMACGIPALMTSVGGITEYLKDGQNGFFIRQDPEDIAQKVLLLLENESMRKAMGEKARETALQYSWDRVADKYLELIHEVWEERNKGV